MTSSMPGAGSPEIVFYTRQLHNGGVDRVVFNLAEEFMARGVRATILVDVDNEWSPFRALIPQGVAYHVLGARGPLARLTKLRAFLRQRRPQAVMCTSFGFPNLYAVAARRLAGVPFQLMLTEHCYPSIDEAAPRPWQSRWWFFRLARKLYPMADHVVAVSRGTAKDLARVMRMDPERIECIYNPIVSDDLIAGGQQPVDHAWFADGALPVVMAVGRLEAQKNFALLIRAFAVVRREMPCRLMILGDGSQREALTELVASLGLADDVAMPGFAANPHAYVAKAAMLVLSSNFEALPNVPLEAMALGTPVVATNCPSGPEEELDGGRYGALVPMNDVGALSAAMLKVLRNRPAPVAKSWLQQFTRRHSADRYLELLVPAAA